MNAQEKLHTIINLLHSKYSDTSSMLNFNSPYQLMVAVSLSAQTTDAGVNRVTPELFVKWPNAESLAKAHIEEVETLIHSLGFFRQKARNLVKAAALLCERFGGEVPQEMHELTLLPGVGRKSANVIRAHIWQKPGIIVDTHFGRVCRRLGLTREKSPNAVEAELAARVAAEEQIFFSMAVNMHGRVLCKARRPECGKCFLRQLCPKLYM